MIRIGLIGAGNISSTHARAIADIPGARVAAVYGPTLDRARRVAQIHDAPAFDRLDEFFGGAAMDLVAIGTPSGFHAEPGIAAARRGLHVLVEKPIDISTARADDLIAAACGSGVTLGVIFQDRAKPAIRELKALIEGGTLGRILLVRAEVPWWRPPEYYAQSRWRGTWALDGGGALMNQAIHTVDLTSWICGPVTRVFGRTATQLHQIEVEDTAVAVLDFANGAIGTLEATTCAFPGRARRLEITCERGTAILEGDRLLGANGDAAATAAAPPNVASAVVSDVSAHREVFVDFIAAVGARSQPLCNGRDGRRSVAMVEAIYESSRSGRPVDVKAEYYS